MIQGDFIGILMVMNWDSEFCLVDYGGMKNGWMEDVFIRAL